MKKGIFIFLMIMLISASLSAEDEPGLKAGVAAPDFEAMTHTGERVRLSDFIKNGPVVLVFYRGGWCMYCNRQLQELQSLISEFKAQGASIVAISVDLQKNAAKSVKEKQLDFTVISDPDASLLELYNLVYKVPDELAKKYKEEYKIDLEEASGRSDHVIAIPATYIVDRSGKIVFAYANRDYTVRKSSQELLDVLRSLPK